MIIHAQQECEEMFLSASDTEVTVLPLDKKGQKTEEYPKG